MMWRRLKGYIEVLRKKVYNAFIRFEDLIRSRNLYILILIVILSSVSVYALIYISWNITLKGSIPDVRFYSWSDHTRHTKISLDYDIYPNVWLRIENASYGLENGGFKYKNITLGIQGISDQSKLDELKIIIKDPDGSQVAVLEWRKWQSIDSAKVSFVLKPKTIYTIELWIRGSSNLKVGDEITLYLVIEVYE